MVDETLAIDAARGSDADAVEALLDEAAEWQETRGIDLWRPGRFRDEIEQVTSAGDLYVARQDGSIVGCFMLDEGSPRLTRWLMDHGREPERSVVGRLAVKRDVAGRGLGKRLLHAAASIAAGRGIAFLRLECPSDNEGLRRYYRMVGFSEIGTNHEPGPNGESWVSTIFERRHHAPPDV